MKKQTSKSELRRHKVQVTVHNDSWCRYIRVSEVPEQYREEFNTWMVGQTRPLIDRLKPEEQDAVYVTDWERFIELKLTGTEVWD